MTTTIVLAAAADGYVTCSHPTDWNAAMNGNAPVATNGTTTLRYGAGYVFSTYVSSEAFVSFPYVRPTNETEVSVEVGGYHSAHFGTVSRQMQWWYKGWIPTVDNTDWMTPAFTAATPRGARIYDIQASGVNQLVLAGSNTLTNTARTAGTATYQFGITTDRQLVTNLFPTADEASLLYSAESSLDPVMIVASVPQSTLYGVLGAQVQLSDGGWVYLETETDGAIPPVIRLWHRSADDVFTPIGPLGELFSRAGAGCLQPGSQQIALAVDTDDTVYVVGGRQTVANSICVRAVTRNTFGGWTLQLPVVGNLPISDADANNFVVAWHSVGGGTLVAFVARGASDGVHPAANELCWVVMNAAVTTNGTGLGSLIRATGTAVGTASPALSQTAWTVPANDTGTNMDIVPLNDRRGIVNTVTRVDRLGNRQATCKIRYTLDEGGNLFGAFLFDTTQGQPGATVAVKSASGKVRVLALSADQFATVTADSAFGITVAVMRNSGLEPSFTTLGWILLGTESIPSMPPGSALANSQAWDAIYLQGQNRIWIYYFDVANGRRLMRTSIDLDTMLATREETDVSASSTGFGPVGSTNVAIRVDRGSRTQRRVLIVVANRASDGTFDNIQLVDTPNQPPQAPNLTSRSNFDATTTVELQWSHVDVDFGDQQTRYQLDINTALGADVFDTGMVFSSNPHHSLTAGTLTNGVAYQWRVRTWDEAGEVGPYSAFASFSAASGGTVTIIDPAGDNPPNIITASYPVTWTLTGATQAAYRVVVRRTVDDVVTSDTGWVTSSLTTYLVTGMATDIEHRIEVTTRSSLSVQSNTGFRLITPSYGTPDVPTLSVLADPAGGYTLLAISNPPTSGDRPDVVHNEIRRRIEATTTTDAGPWVSIGATGLGGTWKDFAAASGVTYEYQVVAVAADGSYSLSFRHDGTLCLQGIWIHDPDDPANAELSAQHYRYGWRGKGDETTVVAEAVFYAGRESPVYDYGEHVTETLTVPIQVPRGDDWLAQITALKELPRARRTLCIRDARGRRIFGAITSVSRDDEQWGTSVSFTVTTVHYVEHYTAFGEPVVVIGDGLDADDDHTPNSLDGGDVIGGAEETVDGGDICGGDPECAGDVVVDAGGAT